MRLMKYLLAVWLLAACGGSSAPTSAAIPEPCADAGAFATDSGNDGATDGRVESGPCALRVDSLSPTTVPATGGVLVLMKGCGFFGVRDLQVNVNSVAYAIVDDETIVFRAWVPESPIELPYSAAVDVIRIQPDQVQTTLVYR